MSTYEATVSLLEGLSEDQLIQVQNLARRYKQKAINNPFKAMSEDELFIKIDQAIAHAESGIVLDANVSVQEFREKYGL